MTPALVTVLLIVHGLLGVALLGAITHQSFGVVQRTRGQGSRSFLDRFGQIDASAYTNAVVLLFVITSIGGAFLYAPYRVDVRPALEDRQLLAANGVFEIKEHLAAIGLGLLPAYWVFWRKTLEAGDMRTRRYLTWMIAFCTWWNFIAGHVLNNIKGLI
jgi:hypothetical protein